MIALLHLANPTAYAARSQLDRAEASLHQEPGSASCAGRAYLATLGSDAAPILVGRIDELTGAARCELASALLARWGSDGEWDWRSWNLADREARRVVGSHAARLSAMTEEEGGCG